MEETWIFFGQCIPARFPMTFDFPSEVGIRSEFGDLVCSATIFAGQAVVRVTAQNEITNIFTLRNIVEQLLRTVADAITFVLGNSVSIDIIAAVRSDQWTWHVFGTSIPALTGRGRPSLPAIALSPDFFSVIAQSPELILALASLSRSDAEARRDRSVLLSSRGSSARAFQDADRQRQGSVGAITL